MKKVETMENKGITLIALIITIIILLILAGISIAAIVGDNGVTKQAVNASEKTTVAREKEAIGIAWSALYGYQLVDGTEITNTNFQEELNKNGNDTTVEYDEEENFLVFFKDTKHTYKVERNGTVSESKTIYYTIKYVLNGGTNATGQIETYAGGETVSLLNATKDNSYFQGWYESSDFSTSRVTSISNRQEDITLYAKFVDETPTGYFTWTTTADAATITGFSAEGLTVYNAGNLTMLAIPRKYSNLPVTTIGNSAFSGKNLIKELIIPDSFKTFNNQSFKNCTGLTKLIIPISISAAPVPSSQYDKNLNAFINCTGIKEVYITKGTRIGS